MENIKSKHGISVSIMVVVMIAVATIFGGGIYVYVNNKAESERRDLNVQIDKLQSQVSGAATTTKEGNAVITYVHPEFKYSLSLPSGYIGVDSYGCEGSCSSDLTIAKKVTDGSYSNTYVDLLYYKPMYSFEKIVDDYKKDISDLMDESDSNINGVAAKKFKVGGLTEGFEYLAMSNGCLLKIRQNPSTTENQKIVDSIVSTFRFTK